MRTWDDIAADEGLWSTLGGRAVVLVMDFDGTLSPFVADPAAARPYPGVRRALDGLAAGGCRLVFVTGRDCRQLPGLLGLARTPEVWGSHGGERLLPDGSVRALSLPGEVRQGLMEAAGRAEEAGWGDALEAKPGCLSFHVRAMPEAQRVPALEDAQSAWSGLAATYGLVLRAFDGGVELRAPGMDKGRAVRAVLDEGGPEHAVFYLGDDDTDEDAFAAIEGRGTGVLVRPEPRPSAAGWWLRPPDDLLAFLGRVARAVGAA